MLNDSFTTTNDETQPLAPPASSGRGEASRLIKAEVNLLRLPVFALQTKGLRNLDGFECRGTITRSGQAHEYLWRVTRHATRPYPGPLARAAHLALLDILTERGVPFANPITWTWRDLCRRIGISYYGRGVESLKEAIRATHGLLIESAGAIYSKKAGQLIALAEDDRSLYSRVRFSSRRGEDGSPSEENGVWLAPWYLDSLNALYTAPLDHQLWRYLDRHSPIASRLYEHLLPVFFSPAPFLRINYPYLAQSLPVRVERYFSGARKQLGAALELLQQEKIVSRVDWAPHKNSIAQLQFFRGARFDGRQANVRSIQSDGLLTEPATLAMRELRSRPSAQEQLVREFYRLWSGSFVQKPSARELAEADQIVAAYGLTKARAMLPAALRTLKSQWPAAKTFTAVATYWPQVVEAVRRQEGEAQRRKAAAREDRELHSRFDKQAIERQRFVARWQPLWNKSPADEQDEIRRTVLAGKDWLRAMPDKLAYECLLVLSRRSAGGQADAPSGPSPKANQ